MTLTGGKYVRCEQEYCRLLVARGDFVCLQTRIALSNLYVKFLRAAFKIMAPPKIASPVPKVPPGPPLNGPDVMHFVRAFSIMRA